MRAVVLVGAVLLSSTASTAAPSAGEGAVPIRGVVAQAEAPQPEQTPGEEDPAPLSPWLWGGLIAFAAVGAVIAVTIMRRNRPRAGR